MSERLSPVLDGLDAGSALSGPEKIVGITGGTAATWLASQIATYITALIVDAAPSTLDTLNELAAALGDDPNFATTVTTALAGKQPLDTDLTAIAALASAADKIPYATGSGTWALADFKADIRTLAAAASMSALRTAAGLAIGSDVQAYDSDLAAIAALATTSFGRSFLALADAAAARALAGLVIGTDVAPVASPSFTGSVGIGTSSPSELLHLLSTTDADILMETQANAEFSGVFMRRTRAALAAVQALDTLGALSFWGFGGTNYRRLNDIISFVNTYTSDSNIIGSLQIRTSVDGVATPVARITALSNGNVGINDTDPLSKLSITGGCLNKAGYTVATLPTARAGDEARVTDALSPVFGSAVVGGGTVSVPVFYNQANVWIVG